jgi:PhnB protein
MSIKPIPDGYHSVTPYLIVRGAVQALDFYQRAFGAKEIMRLTMPDGTLGHAEMQIGDSRVLLGDEAPQRNVKSPSTLGGSSVHLLIHLAGVDAAIGRAIAAGATEVRPTADQFYGDRSGTVSDPFGHQWTLSTRIEDMSAPEMQRRMDALMKQG